MWRCGECDESAANPQNHAARARFGQVEFVLIYCALADWMRPRRVLCGPVLCAASEAARDGHPNKESWNFYEYRT
jgi:hypothetical protein